MASTWRTSTRALRKRRKSAISAKWTAWSSSTRASQRLRISLSSSSSKPWKSSDCSSSKKWKCANSASSSNSWQSRGNRKRNQDETITEMTNLATAVTARLALTAVALIVKITADLTGRPPARSRTTVARNAIRRLLISKTRSLAIVTKRSKYTTQTPTTMQTKRLSPALPDVVLRMSRAI